jgi:hypothetical protein
MSLAAQLRDPHTPVRSSRVPRWLFLGVIELGIVAGIGWWVGRSGVDNLARAAKAVKESEAALIAACHGSAKFAYAVANTAPEDHVEMLVRAEAVDRDQPIADRVRAAEALDREVAYVLANPPARLESLWRRMRGSLPGIAKTRETNKMNFALAQGRYREAGQEYAARLAIYLKMAEPPPATAAPAR